MVKDTNLSKKLIISLIVLTTLILINCFWQGMMWIVFSLLLFLCLTDSLENGFTYILYMVPYFLMNGSFGSILYFCCILAFVVKFYVVLFFVDKVKLTKKELILMGILLLYICIPFGGYNLNWLVKFFLIIFVIVFINAFSRKSNFFSIKILSVNLVFISIRPPVQDVVLVR